MRRAAFLLGAALVAGCGTTAELETGGTPSSPAETTTVVESVVTRVGAPTATEPAPQEGLPAAVEETRRAIVEAASSRDYGALNELIPAQGFTYTYGGGEAGGPVGYWRELEDHGEHPLETLGALLLLPYTKAEHAYVWPWAYDRNPAMLTERERDRLVDAGAASADELEQMADFGHYLGWRVGIRSDGTWVFFVAGD